MLQRSTLTIQLTRTFFEQMKASYIINHHKQLQLYYRMTAQILAITSPCYSRLADQGHSNWIILYSLVASSSTPSLNQLFYKRPDPGHLAFSFENSPIYKNLINYEKASDSLKRRSLWQPLRHNGIPEKIVSIISNSYCKMTCRVVGGCQLTCAFQVKTRVRQGRLLFPF